MRLLLVGGQELLLVLRQQKYRVDTVENALEAVDYACGGDYDGILVDGGSPESDCVYAVKLLRAQGVKTPILALPAHGRSGERAKCLDAGADDALSRPLSAREFSARLRALTRRSAEYHPDTLTIGDLSLDRQKRLLRCGQTEQRLRGREYEMAELLFLHAGKPISTESFLTRLWGCESEADIGIVWVYLSRLRKKLEKLGTRAAITSQRGLGYLLECPANPSQKA